MTILTLPADCDRAAAIVLHPELCAQAQSEAVTIDGTECRKIGLAMMQLLLAARRTNQKLTIEASEELREAVHLAGLSGQLLD